MTQEWIKPIVQIILISDTRGGADAIPEEEGGFLC